MGILNRFTEIMKSNINALLDKAEDPAKMIEQTLRGLKEDLATVRKETAVVMADEKRAKRQLDDNAAMVKKFEEAAQAAVLQDNIEDAKKLIAKKQQYEENQASLQKTYDTAHENSEKMQKMYDKLTADIDSLEIRKDAILSKVATAKVQQKVNKIVGGTDKAEGSKQAFDRMEKKADQMLDQATSEAELNEKREKDEDLADFYIGGGSKTKVDEELDELLKKMGKSSPAQ
ncbi:MAG: PspA/IM30 family protein [Lachnospiraceae bacterium]|nr:PspA/IM30 family protein [Lachnospiraceae bacterium]